MLFEKPQEAANELRDALNKAYRMDENDCVNHLLDNIQLSTSQITRIESTARQLMTQVRDKRLSSKGLDSFMYEYDLSSEEGIALMCLAEALLRIPDKKTIDDLIKDKIAGADWKAHLGQSSSFTVNAATWGLLLTGKVLDTNSSKENLLTSTVKKFISRSGEPMIRKAVGQAMKIMSHQFVMGRTIDEAIKRARSNEKMGYRYSYDMLGEAAVTADDADRYFDSYLNAIRAIGKAAAGKGVIDGPGVSVKLSALHPRYEFAKRERVLDELVPKLFALASEAKHYDIALTIDAEEADRLDLSLDVIERVFSDPSLKEWEGFGLALQSYQKRAWYLIDWLADLARRNKRRLKVRLIKGAYWDTEIKHTQEQGFNSYPVFTRKASTDVSFLACAQKIIAHSDALYPQFATHNAYSVAAVLEMMGDRTDFEFQCLHGMGQSMYDEIVPKDKMGIPCRIYAPVGSHEDLLPYLVRRLLENGANSSFVNRIIDDKTPIDELIENPVAHVKALADKPHPYIPLPRNLFGEARLNSHGIDVTNLDEINTLDKKFDEVAKNSWMAGPIINDKEDNEGGVAVYAPFNHRIQVGTVKEANEENVDAALSSAHKAAPRWDKVSAEERAACLERTADLFEKHVAELMYLAVHEAGKTINDANSEVREAIDFCRYYAAQCRELFSTPTTLPGYTGESNQLSLHGRGVVLCISPWNFPAAIFVGQVTAALAAGNAVIAKPAEQTPLIAALCVRLMHAAGVPGDVLHLLPGRGEIVGAKCVADERVNGVIFTGSTQTARIINQTLAKREGPIVPLIAETGGQNAMIVDSSALLEQVVKDVLTSSCYSAGQRCSALRVLFVQDEIADNLMEMLAGAMAELSVGDPSLLETDIGPVIDEEAQEMLAEHMRRMDDEAKLIYQVALPSLCEHGTFIAPTAYEIKSLQELPQEVFGPILHIIRFKSNELDKVIDSINNTGYGLTCGLHSRIDETIDYITQRVKVGNCYVNRNMIGAIVGVQPFGGEGLSGTGPKAGGPHYLLRLCTERTLTVDTTAAGGNASLMSLQEE